jgi:UDP-glucose:(heptosyl)LPS alpha-1,3-glucosyltransferase
MKIAFAIVSLFPGGGLQRDCIEIAQCVRKMGHEVVIYACRLRENTPTGDIPTLLLPNRKISNHKRQQQFAIDFLAATSGRFDLTVGFDKLLDLDVLYCADPSMEYRLLTRPYLKLISRYRTYRDLEQNSFGPQKLTRLILLTHHQLAEYVSAWGTEKNRTVVIPPTLAIDRRHPEYRTNGVRNQLREQLGLANHDWVWISIGVYPQTKGFDRVVRALTKFPEARLLITGLTETEHASENLVKLSEQLGVAARVKWLAHREDIPQLLAAADLLVHPARYDTAGLVILEAIVNGLPVITTSTCGNAQHVESAKAGVVIGTPFEFHSFVASIEKARASVVSNGWPKAGEEYGHNQALYQGRSNAAEIIVETVRNRDRCAGK